MRASNIAGAVRDAATECAGLRMRCSSVVALAICLVLNAPPLKAAQRPAHPDRAVVVRNDPGGVLPARIASVASIRSSGQRVELRGRYCLSACTLYLGLPNACVSPQTRFGFHGPSMYGRPLKSKDFERWSKVMASHYPEPLRSWFMEKARYQVTGYVNLRGEDLIANYGQRVLTLQ